MTEENTVPTSAGLSSFNLLDEKKLFNSLDLQPGMQVLDFGCGVGNYALAMAPYLGKSGKVCAVDPWDEGVETLNVRIGISSQDTISTAVCAAGDRLPIIDRSMDLCLLATVIHILVQENLLETTVPEIERVLKPGAPVAVVEFYKKEGPPGPPLTWRLSPDDLQEVMASFGFYQQLTTQVGPHNFLSLFKREAV